MNRRWALALALVIMAGLFTGCLGGENGNGDGDGNGDDLPDAPPFQVTDTDGKLFNLSWNSGRVVLIDLMGVECASCKQMEPVLKALHENYTSAQVRFVSVDVWAGPDGVETEEDLRAHKEAENISWPMAVDSDDVVTKYDALDIVKIVIVDKEGKIAYAKVGIVSFETLKQEIDAAL